MFRFVSAADPAAVQRLIDAGASPVLVDVRSRAEYANGHARGAIPIPITELDRAQIKARLGDEAGTVRPLYLICESGARAEQAAHRLADAGLHNVHLVNGGTAAWRSQGLPVVRSAPVPSLEHQVQIAVGAVILLILAKALLLHPVFYLLIGLIAVALIVAGITARCSLSSLLARMPWNRRAADGLAPSR